MTTRIEKTARLTHEMNKRWCELLGDDSQPAWEDAPDWQRKSAVSGVASVLNGEALNAEEQHMCWRMMKAEDGWVYGERKDAEAKTHPCMVPYDDLPPEQKAKDAIFRAVVLSQFPES